MRRIILAVILITTCGCAQREYRNDSQVVEMAKLGVVYRITAPKEVVIGDEYEVTHEVGVK